MKKRLPPAETVDLIQHGLQLKHTTRAGWLLKGIDQPETVSEHSHLTAFIALLLARSEGLDEHKVVKTALVHDLGEAVMGDVIWEQGSISNKKKQAHKHTTETATIKQIFNSVQQDDLRDLAIDFLEQQTPEAKVVKEADKLEMIFQALDYEAHVADPNSLLEFWENAAKYLHSDSAWAIFEELKSRSKITHPLPGRPAPTRR